MASAAKTIRIGSRDVGRGCPCFIIAELSANHNNDVSRAKRIIAAAKEAGADAIKLQTYTADTITLKCSNKYFSIADGPWAGRTLYDLYQQAATPWEWQSELKAYAESIGLICFSTPFDSTAVDFLEKIAVPAYKIASFEIVDIPLISYIAGKGKPIILSTGMSGLGDIETAVAAIRAAGNNTIILLKCTSDYPARIEEMNLSALAVLENAFATPVGLSDHSIDTIVSTTAVALGACVIEKHITERRSDGGPDAHFSLEPSEFKKMVEAIRAVESVLGTPRLQAAQHEQKNAIFRKSIFAAAPISKGERFSAHNIRIVRPGYGLEPKHYPLVIGKKAANDIDFGTPLAWRHIENENE